MAEPKSDPPTEELFYPVEIERLRAIGQWMREVGATELTHHGLHIKLGPQPPKQETLTHEERDERAALTEEERAAAALSAEERAHYERWSRITRSSGAPIPKFKRELAKLTKAAQ